MNLEAGLGSLGRVRIVRASWNISEVPLLEKSSSAAYFPFEANSAAPRGKSDTVIALRHHMSLIRSRPTWVTESPAGVEISATRQRSLP